MKPEHLREPYNHIARLIGIDAAIVLAKEFGGEQIYFPATVSYCKEVRNNHICLEFNGYNYKELAKKYGLSERGIRRIIKSK